MVVYKDWEFPADHTRCIIIAQKELMRWLMETDHHEVSDGWSDSSGEHTWQE